MTVNLNNFGINNHDITGLVINNDMANEAINIIHDGLGETTVYHEGIATEVDRQLTNKNLPRLSILERLRFLGNIRGINPYMVSSPIYTIDRTTVNFDSKYTLHITISPSRNNIHIEITYPHIARDPSPTRKELYESVWQRTREAIVKWQPKKFPSTEFIPGEQEGEIRVKGYTVTWINKLSRKLTRLILPDNASKEDLNLIRYRLRQMGFKVKATGRHEVIAYERKCEGPEGKIGIDLITERLYYGKLFFIPEDINIAIGSPEFSFKPKQIEEQLKLGLVDEQVIRIGSNGTVFNYPGTSVSQHSYGFSGPAYSSYFTVPSTMATTNVTTSVTNGNVNPFYYVYPPVN